MNETQCDSCDKIFKYSSEMAGRKGRCPRCKTVIDLPELPDERQHEDTEQANELEPKNQPLRGPDSPKQVPTALPLGSAVNQVNPYSKDGISTPPNPPPQNQPSQNPALVYPQQAQSFAVQPQVPLQPQVQQPQTQQPPSSGLPQVHAVPPKWQSPNQSKLVLRRRVKGRIAGPAISLIVISIIQLLFIAIVLVLNIKFGVQQNAELGKIYGPEVLNWMESLSAVTNIFAILLNLAILFGCSQVMQFRMWGFGIFACIVGLLPLSGCCILPLPFAIWLLVVLNDSEVHRAF